MTRSTLDNSATALYRKCPECLAGLEDLYVGGVGDWQDTIMCTKCFKIMDRVPEVVVMELLAEINAEKGFDIAECRKRQKAAQDNYEATLADLTSFRDTAASR